MRFKVGGTAMMVFFILSGGRVNRMFHQKYLTSTRPLRMFDLSRLLLIWLLYTAVFLIAVAISHLIGGRRGPRARLGLPTFGGAAVFYFGLDSRYERLWLVRAARARGDTCIPVWGIPMSAHWRWGNDLYGN